MDELDRKLGFDKMPLSEIVDAAHKEISALCKGKDWRMSIPIQWNDSDTIISTALKFQRDKISNLELENMQLRKALEFYADDNNWNMPGEWDRPNLELDGGTIAREALKKKGG